MMRSAIVACLLLLVMVVGPAVHGRQDVDGASQRERAEEILNEPRFGETRPTLWDRLNDWWDDTFTSSDQTADPNTAGTNDGSSGAGGGGTNRTDEGGTSGSNPGAEQPSAEGGSNNGSGTAPAQTETAGGFAALGTGLQIALGLVLLVATALGARWAISRRTARAKPAKKDLILEPVEPSATELFDGAEAAAARGDYATAVRLRFRAGIARLGNRGAISEGEVTTNAVLAQELQLEEFDQLTGTFERIVYGGYGAQAEQDEESRMKWPTVIDRAGR